MKQKTIYSVSACAEESTYGFNGYFLQCPTKKELLGAIDGEIERLSAPVVAGGSNEEEIADLKDAIDVVRNAEEFVAPLFGKTHLDVLVASIRVGTIVVEAVTAYGRCPQLALEELVA